MSHTPTRLVYLDDMYRYCQSATIIDCAKLADGSIAVITDQTIFYVQGGGQPSDHGVIQDLSGNTFEVQQVKAENAVVHHIGIFTKGSFTPGAQVTLSIDQTLREIHNRNHTAGHLIDYALNNLGYQLKSGKGYHFPQGPYVEYLGTLEQEERENLIEPLQHAINRIIEHDLPVTIKHEISQNPHLTRFMTLPNYPAIHCGGTHVKKTGEIGKVIIRKIKNEKNNLRISYSLAS